MAKHPQYSFLPSISNLLNKQNASSPNSVKFETLSKTPKIPGELPIPQREKDKAKITEARKKAAEAFKQSQDSKISKK